MKLFLYAWSEACNNSRARATAPNHYHHHILHHLHQSYHIISNLLSLVLQFKHPERVIHSIHIITAHLMHRVNGARINTIAQYPSPPPSPPLIYYRRFYYIIHHQHLLSAQYPPCKYEPREWQKGLATSIIWGSRASRIRTFGSANAISKEYT